MENTSDVPRRFPKKSFLISDILVESTKVKTNKGESQIGEHNIVDNSYEKPSYDSVFPWTNWNADNEAEYAVSHSEKLLWSDSRPHIELSNPRNSSTIPSMQDRPLLSTENHFDMFGISSIEESQTIRKKKTRTVFSRSQIYQLESTFDMKRYLSSADRTALANSLKLTETQIKIWFQNRRNKWKRQLSADIDTQSCFHIDPCAQVRIPVLCSPYKYHHGFLPGNAQLRSCVGQTPFLNKSLAIQKPFPTLTYTSSA